MSELNIVLLRVWFLAYKLFAKKIIQFSNA